MPAPRVIFAGTPDFALASLTALVGAGVRPVAVLTQPDRPAGRGRRLTPSPVKRFALEQDLNVLQPTTLRDSELDRSPDEAPRVSWKEQGSLTCCAPRESLFPFHPSFST